MILKYFKKKKNNTLDLYNNLYIDIIDSTKFISFKTLKIKNIDFVITFEIVSILLFCIFFGNKNNTQNNFKFEKQLLMNIFISDIDHSLRLQGLDMTLGKNVKNYVKKFYFRLKELEKIFTNNSISDFEIYLTNYNLSNRFINQVIVARFFDELVILIKKDVKINIIQSFYLKIYLIRTCNHFFFQYEFACYGST